jgi:hypothetical protein
MEKWERNGVFDDVQSGDGRSEQGPPMQGKNLKDKQAPREEIVRNEEPRKLDDVKGKEAQDKELAWSPRDREEEAKETDIARQEEYARKIQEATRKMEAAKKIEEARRMEEEGKKQQEEAMEDEAVRKVDEAKKKEDEAQKKRDEAKKKKDEAQKKKDEAKKKKDEAKKKKDEAKKDKEAVASKKKEEKKIEDARKREAKKEQGAKRSEEKNHELYKRQEAENEEIRNETRTRPKVKRARFAEPEALTPALKDSGRSGVVTMDEAASEPDEETDAKDKTAAARKGTAAPLEVGTGDGDADGRMVLVTGHQNIEKPKRKPIPPRPGNVVRDDIIAEEKEKGKKPLSTHRKLITITLLHPCTHCNVRGTACTMTNTSDNRRSCDNCYTSKKKCGIIKNKVFLIEKAKESSVFGLVAARMLKAVEENEGGEDEDEDEDGMGISDEGDPPEFSSKFRAYIWQHLLNTL